MTSRTRWLLGVLCAWTAFLWTNRLVNAWSSTTETTGQRVVSTVLAASFLALAAIGVGVLVRAWRRPDTPAPRHFLLGFAGWTVVVWAVRVVGIALADHEVGFVVVHAVLGLVAIGLAAALVRSLRPGDRTALSTVATGHR